MKAGHTNVPLDTSALWMNKPRVYRRGGRWFWSWGAIPAWSSETNQWCRDMNEKERAKLPTSHGAGVS